MTAEDLKISQEPRGGKRHVFLTSWAAVATALFVFALIFGAVYVVNIQPKCDEGSDTNQENTKEVNANIKDGEKDEKETIQRNSNKHTDFIVKKTSEGYIELMAGINYNTKISSVYLAKENICVLSTGEDMDWYEDMPENNTADVNEKNEDADDVYNVNMESKVTDMTLLTSEMQIMCRGKEMYWADKGKKEQEGEHGVGNREKRGWSYRCYRYLYLRCCPWRYYYRYYCRLVYYG